MLELDGVLFQEHSGRCSGSQDSAFGYKRGCWYQENTQESPQMITTLGCQYYKHFNKKSNSALAAVASFVAVGAAAGAHGGVGVGGGAPAAAAAVVGTWRRCQRRASKLLVSGDIALTFRAQYYSMNVKHAGEDGAWGGAQSCAQLFPFVTFNAKRCPKPKH
eukprot:1157837-Pelagomonas_calceolata.AAC.14